MHEIKLIVKQIFCIKLVKYWDKYTEMHGQQNVKINLLSLIEDRSLFTVRYCQNLQTRLRLILVFRILNIFVNFHFQKFIVPLIHHTFIFFGKIYL